MCYYSKSTTQLQVGQGWSGFHTFKDINSSSLTYIFLTILFFANLFYTRRFVFKFGALVL